MFVHRVHSASRGGLAVGRGARGIARLRAGASPLVHPQQLYAGITELDRQLPLRFLSGANSATAVEATASGEGRPTSPTLVIATDEAESPGTSHRQPEFTILNAGPSSLLHVKLPPRSYVDAVPGSLLGRSGSTRVRVTARTLWPAAAGRLAVGAHAVLERVSATAAEEAGGDASVDAGGDCLVRARNLGDLALLEVGDGTVYKLRCRALVAAGSGVSLQLSARGLGMASGSGLYAYRVSGSGTLAMHAFGGLYRISLGDREKYYIEPQSIVAWDTRLRMIPHGRESGAATATAATPVPLRRFLSGTWRFCVQQSMWLLRKAIGTRELYEVVGPGEIFLQSRPEPRAWLPLLAPRRAYAPVNPNGSAQLGARPEMADFYAPSTAQRAREYTQSAARAGRATAQTTSKLWRQLSARATKLYNDRNAK